MEFRVFGFKVKKNFKDLLELKKEFETTLDKRKKEFLTSKTRAINEEEQTKGTSSKREKVYELKFRNFLEGISKYNFFSNNTLNICFYTEKENKREGITYSFKRYNERDICNKSPPEVYKKYYFWFKNANEGIVFASGGNPKATEYLLISKISSILPIEIESELKYDNSKVAEIFEDFRKENKVISLNDIRISAKIPNQEKPIYKTIIFDDVGSYEYYDKLSSGFNNILIDKFSAEMELDDHKKFKFIFKSKLDFYPISTSLKSRAHETYSKLFEWLGNLLFNLS